jgi:hypothetical protein
LVSSCQIDGKEIKGHGCGGTYARNTLNQHQLDQCPKGMVKCSLSDVCGCKWSGTRDAQVDHDAKSALDHIRLLAQSLMSTKSRLLKAESDITSLQLQLAMTQAALSVFTTKGVFHVTPTHVQSSSSSPSRSWCAATRIDSDTYIITGGLGPTPNGVQQYRLSTNRWSALPSMSMQRHCHRCVTLHNPLRVMCIGGFDGNNVTASCEIYDVSTKIWSRAASLRFGRSGSACAVHENKVYVFGGSREGYSTDPLSSCEVYDEKKDRWTRIAPMSTGRFDATAVVVGSTILVLGGAVTDAGQLRRTDMITEYTPTTNTWRTSSWALPQPRRRFGASYKASAGLLIIAGGIGGGTTNVYTRSHPFVTNEWIRCPDVKLDAYCGYC